MSTYPELIHTQETLGDSSFEAEMQELIGFLHQAAKEEWDDGRATDLAAALRACQKVCQNERGVSTERAYRWATLLVEVCGLADRDGYSELTTARASAYRAAGAIASDQYRSTSEIAYHIEALGWELTALRLFASLDDHVRVLSDFVDAINSVSVSAYRLRNYAVALPLADLAAAACRTHESRISKPIRAKVLRDRATTYYACALDHVDGIGGPMVPAEDKENLVQKLAEESRKSAVDARVADPERTWNALITEAEAHFLLGEKGRALAVLKNLREEIGQQAEMLLDDSFETRGRATAFMLETLGRCCYQLARFSGMLAHDAEDTAEAYVQASRYAAESVALRSWACGLDHVDVRKSVGLFDLLLDQANGMQPVLSENVAREVEQAKAHFGWELAPLRVTELVNAIVKGDALSVNQLFNLTVGEYKSLYRRLTGKELPEEHAQESADPTRQLPEIGWIEPWISGEKEIN